ncbi:Uncharacterised protein [Mycobacteroides abscessus subsp. abscessus]|nr:Uncharacterised protein [Mycobacteroides abscessus subsp. abscessus]
MVDHRTDPAYRSAGRGHLVARCRSIGGTVQMQQHQRTRWLAQVVHPGHRLLPAIAALGQMHGPWIVTDGDPSHLVRYGPLIGVQGEAGAGGGHPQRLERPESGGTHP